MPRDALGWRPQERGAQAAGALTSIASGIIGGGARRREEKACLMSYLGIIVSHLV